MLPFVDVSYAQGNYDMQSNPDSIVAVRMSSGDGGLHFDSQAATNYKNATDYGKVIINYHFAGNGDPTTEAKFFIEAVSPFAQYDIYALDIEMGQDAGWINTFVNVVHNATGCWPLVYMNISTANSLWSDVNGNCGLWLAAPSWGFNQTITELDPNIMYVAQQGPIVNGVDSDMFFASDLNHVKDYGYNALPPPTPAPQPQPAPTPPPTPMPVPTPVPTPAPTPQPSPLPVTTAPSPFPSPLPEPTNIWQDIKNLWSRFLKFIYKG